MLFSQAGTVLFWEKKKKKKSNTSQQNVMTNMFTNDWMKGDKVAGDHLDGIKWQVGSYWNQACDK